MSWPNRTLSYHLVLDREMKSKSDYFLLPFEIGAGVQELEINYSYERGSEGDPNVIDLGLFGPGETAFLKAKSFRGWSGSNKSAVCVSETNATPGYYHGKIEAGKWSVILGLATISSQGCPCDVTVTTRNEIKGRGTVRQTTRARVPTVGVGETEAWLRGDLHVHSHHSDGSLSVELVAGEALRRGLDFVAVTDHNTTSQAREVACLREAGLIVMVGEELTTCHGHANVWNTQDWLDFRFETKDDAEAVIAEAHRRRLLFSVNHPNSLYPWEFKDATGFDCIEVWCGLWARLNFESLEWWDELTRDGLRVIGVGGSDFHSPEPPETRDIFSIGSPTTWVLSTGKTAESIMDGIRAGRVFVSRAPGGPRLSLRAKTSRGVNWMGDHVCCTKGEDIEICVQASSARGLGLRVLSSSGILKSAKTDSTESSITLRTKVDSPDFLRAELVEAEGDWASAPPSDLDMASITNHLYVFPESD